MKIDPQKLSDQLSFINTWKSKGAKGSLVAITGYGKSMVGILAIRDMNLRHHDRITHVIVPTTALKKQWEDHIISWNLNHVKVYVINTYITQNRFTHLLVLDEIHRYGSRTFSSVFSNTQYSFVLGLTATIERQDGNHLLLEKHAPVLRRITLNEALEKNYVSDFIVFNLGVELTQNEKAEYDEINRKFNYTFSLFDNDLGKAIYALQNPAYRKSLALISGRDSTEILVDAVNFIKIMHKRKSFLNEAPSKLYAVKELFKMLNRKMVVFSETTDFADKVVGTIGPESFAYHSACINKKEMNGKLLQFKRTSNYKLLSAVKSLDEGLDIPDLGIAVLVSGNSTKRQYIQRIGRSLRASPGKTAIIINMYVNGTKDENWLKARQFANEINVIWVNSVGQIKEYVHKTMDGCPDMVESDNPQYNPFNYPEADFNPFRSNCI